jgi:hypothetical protein
LKPTTIPAMQAQNSAMPPMYAISTIVLQGNVTVEAYFWGRKNGIEREAVGVKKA